MLQSSPDHHISHTFIAKVTSKMKTISANVTSNNSGHYSGMAKELQKQENRLV